jgi:hypothetical protein
MSDLRSCCLCDREIDIEAPGTNIFRSGRGGGRRLTVIDSEGQAHIVTTRYESERKRNKVVHAPSAEEKEK